MLARFCYLRNKNDYEFFLSRQGYLSLVLAQDKRALIKIGLLAEQEAFTLQQEGAYLEQLKPADQEVLLTVAKESDQILQSQTFSTEFETREKASLSKEYLKTEEVAQQTNSPCLFTLGYEGLSIDAYLKFLLTSDIAVLVDVRKNPLSRKCGFSKQQLAQFARINSSFLVLSQQHSDSAGCMFV